MSSGGVPGWAMLVLESDEENSEDVYDNVEVYVQQYDNDGEVDDDDDDDDNDDDDNDDDDDDEDIGDPDYVPSVPMEDDSNTETQQSLPDSAESSAAPTIQKEQNIQSTSRVADEQEKSAIAASQNTSSDENCTICFEPWTTSSEHRLVSLRCGHLFGRSCISQWLKGQNSRCPQCNARARRSEIRNIYARSIKVLDSTERDKALKELSEETRLRRAAEMEAAQERMKHCLAVQECERLKKELMEAQKQLQEFRSGSKKQKPSGFAGMKPRFKFLEKLSICKDEGCRIVNSSDLLGMILVSQPSSNSLFQGFGFRKILTMNMKPCDFVLVHKKIIRDMALHIHDGLVLTASVDKTLKITNVLSNTVVQTYDVPADAWSCAWDDDNPMYFYGGLRSGEALVFDIRVTNRYVCELPRFGSTPVVSLQYLRKPAYSGISHGGPITGRLTECVLHQKTDTAEVYNSVSMPALGPFTCLSTGGTGQVLVSCRSSVKQPHISHTFCDFVKTSSGEITCCPIRTVFGGKTQIQLTRSRLFNHPDNASSVLICAGDEDANGGIIWDGTSGEIVDTLPSESTVLDFGVLKSEQKYILTALNSKNLLVYEWDR